MTAYTLPRLIDWTDPAYLLRGNARQRDAHATLSKLGIFDTLGAYQPVLVGTVPLDVDIPRSDLDVICAAHNLAIFEQSVRAAYGHLRGFCVRRREDGSDQPAIVANFSFNHWMVEIFGQPRPVTEQRAYRHMVIEARLLALAGEPARAAIRSLKQGGLKTEPAFARCFNLVGDPYRRLLELAHLAEESGSAALAAAVGLDDPLQE
ncbi:MAG: DUF4269 domain-containing protein [Anaerolineae bacterium]|nr:DUF4269 domain-containing protein [Anaerolineae bacterium]